MASLPLHGLAAVAELVRAGDGDERPRVGKAVERQTDSAVRVAARERDRARRFRLADGDFLRRLLARGARRADGSVELAGRRFAAQPRERLAGLASAAIELRHPLLAEAKRRRELERAAPLGSGSGELRPREREGLPHRGRHLLGALSRS